MGYRGSAQLHSMEVLNAVVVLCNLLVAEVVFQAKSQQNSTERDTLISRDGDIHWPANQLKQCPLFITKIEEEGDREQ